MKKIFVLVASLFLCTLFANAQNNVIDSNLQEILNQKSDSYIDVNIVFKSQMTTDDFAVLNCKSDSKDVRRELIINELKKFAEKSQRDVMSVINAEERSNSVIDIKTHWIANFINCKAKRDVIYQLASHPDVASISYNNEMEVVSDAKETNSRGTRASSAVVGEHITQIQADKVWELGYTGKGVIVAVLDSGVNTDHPDLKNQLWNGNAQHGYNVVNPGQDPIDTGSHGTHCAGIVCGDGTSGTKTGVAPDAQLMSIKLYEGNKGLTIERLATAIEFATDNNADILSISQGWLAASDADRTTLRTMFENLLEQGVVAVVAAGNDGENTTYQAPYNVRTPGDCPPPWLHSDQTTKGGLSSVVSVGGVNKNNEILAISSRGPVKWNDYPIANGGLIRPDIVAPGLVYSLSNDLSVVYATKGGTSEAAPCVAGVMALMLEKNPELTPADLCRIVETTATKITATKSNEYGSGVIDALAAVQAVNFNVATPYLSQYSFTKNLTFGTNQNIELSLINNGGVATNGNTTVTLATNDAYTTIVEDSKTYSTMAVGGTATATFVVSVNTLVPDNHVVTFTVTATNGSYSRTFNIDVNVSNEFVAPSLVAQANGTDVNLTWNATNNATSYNVYRDGALLANTTSTSYTDAGLEYGTFYTYAVTSKRGDLESETSLGVRVQTGDNPDRPAPTNVIANNSGKVTWTNGADSKGANIYRKDYLAGTETSIATNVNGTSYTDNNWNTLDDNIYQYGVSNLYAQNETIYQEGFEGTALKNTYEAGEWYYYRDTTGYAHAWTFAESISNGKQYLPHLGSEAAFIMSNSYTATHLTYLVTPQMNYVQHDGKNVKLSFHYITPAWGADINTLKVMISTDTYTGTWTELWSSGKTDVQEWTYQEVDLSAYVGQQFYIAFLNVAGYGYCTGVDEVSVYVENEVESRIEWSESVGKNVNMFVQDGDWSNTDNWTAKRLPNANDTKVIIDANATITSGSIEVNSLVINEGNTLTLNDGVILTVNDDFANTDVDAFIINDGAQVFQNNEDVSATFRMNINNPTEWLTANTTGWQFIASPLKYSKISDFVPSSYSDYDLYKYDGTKTYEWLNHKDENIYDVPTTDTIVVGEGNYTTSSAPIYDAYVSYSYSQQIYLKEEIGKNEGLITSISFHNSAGASNTRNIIVYMSNVDKASFENTSDHIAVTEDDIVYQGEHTFGVAESWSTIELQTPFIYEGGNIAITVNDKTGAQPSSSYDTFYATATTETRGLYGSSSSTPFNCSNLTGYFYLLKSGYPDYAPCVADIQFTVKELEADVRVKPEAIAFGEVQLGEYWSETSEMTVPVRVKPLATTIKNITCDNDFFVLSEIDYSANPINFTVSCDKNAAAGVKEGNITITYGKGEKKIIPVTATAFAPATPDVFELAQSITFTNDAYTDTPEFANLKDDYDLPKEVNAGNTPDAVYSFELANESLVTIDVTGTNAVYAIYSEDFNGQGGPKADNNNKGNAPAASSFFYDFNNGDLNDFNLLDIDGDTYNWTIENVDGSNCIKSYSWKSSPSISKANNVIVTKDVYNITANSKLSFDVAYNQYGSSWPDKVRVEVSKDGESFTLIETVNPGSSSLVNKTVDLGAGLANQGLEYGEYYVALRHQETNMYDIRVDNLRLTGGNNSGAAVAVAYPAGRYYLVAAAEDAFTVDVAVEILTAPVAPMLNAALSVEFPFSAIDLSWGKVDRADSYNVYQNGELLVNVKETSYTAEGLDPEETYCYTVTAVNNAGESVHSEERCLTTEKESTTIGEGNYTGNTNAPINTYTSTGAYTFTYTYSQQIYLKDEIGKANGLITSIAFHNKTGNSNTRNIIVYMSNVDKSSYETTSDQIAVTDADIVYQGEHTFGTSESWTTIELQKPFIYEGENIAITVNDITGKSQPAVYDQFYSTFTTETRGLYAYRDTPYDCSNWDGHLYMLKTSQYAATNPNTPYVADARFVIEELDPMVRVQPEMITFGEVQVGNYWSEKEDATATVSIKPLSTTITSITSDNSFFVLPNAIDYSASKIDLTIAYNRNSAAGAKTGNIVITYGNGETKLVPMTATAYAPATPDVFELAEVISEENYTDVPEFANLRDDYNLPNEVSKGNTPDAVYSFELPAEAFVTVNVSGTNAIAAIYKEDFFGEEGPKEDNDGLVVVPSAPTTFFYDFNDGNLDDFNLIDSDGDGNNWGVKDWYGQDLTELRSYSWGESALNPNNYIITKEPYLITETSKLIFRCSANGSDSYGIYLSDDENIEDSELVYQEKITQWGTWYDRPIELGNYVGVKYIAIRHFNSYGQYYISIDDFQLTDGSTRSTRSVKSRAVDPQINNDVYPAGKYYLVAAAESAFTVDVTLDIAKAPAAPANLVATTINHSSIELTWEDVENVTGYNIYKEGELLEEGWIETTYTVRELDPVTKYCFTVTAVNVIGESEEHSEPVCATTDEIVTCNIVFTLNDSYGDGWSGNTLEVAYGTTLETLTLSSGSSVKHILEIPRGEEVTVTFKGTNYSNENSFIIAYEGGEEIINQPRFTGGSGYVTYTQSYAPFTVYCVPVVPEKPVVTAKAASESTIILEMSAVGAKTFDVYQDGELLVEDLASTTYTVVGLASGTEYCYTVKAANKVGESEMSESSCATTFKAGASIVQIGEAGSLTGYYAPVYDYYKSYSLSQQIYLKDEINSERCSIRSISFQNSYGGPNTRNIVVYMTNVDKTSFASGTDWVAVSESDIVYQGQHTFGVKDEWTTIEFQTPFVYEGNNVCVTINDITGTQITGAYDAFYATLTTEVRGVYASSTSSAYNCANITSVSGVLLQNYTYDNTLYQYVYKPYVTNIKLMTEPLDAAKSVSEGMNINGGFGKAESLGSSVGTELGKFETEFEQGVGYLASYENETVATFKGILNHESSFEFALDYNSGKDLANYHLLGNPFSFNMNWANTTASGLANGYAVVNENGGYEYLTTGEIKVGDGFFVKATSANPTLTYNARSRNNDKQNFINVIASGKAGNDNVIISLSGNEEGFPKIKNFNENIALVYVYENSTPYAIYNCESDVQEVELVFKANNFGAYNFHIETEGMYDYITLIDKVAGTETDMLTSSYSFTTSSQENGNRFLLRFSMSEGNEAEDSFIYQSGEELILNTEGKVQIIDVMGRIIYSNDVTSENNRINVSNFSQAAYVVRLINGDGAKTQKIVVY